MSEFKTKTIKDVIEKCEEIHKSLSKTTCCFTGHRPKSLPWGYKEKGKEFYNFIEKLKSQIELAIKNGYVNFISGMALGVDMIAAEIVLKLKKKHPNIKLECAIPCLNQTSSWQENSIKRYHEILSNADKITTISNTSYFNGCMQKRNEYMLNKSSLLIAVFNASAGGTKHTVDLAKRKGIEIVVITF